MSARITALRLETFSSSQACRDAGFFTEVDAILGKDDLADPEFEGSLVVDG